ncbi:DUF4232 domain-containing protein [Streptomyces sp. MMBL 11-3]|uniref:DUF4232 domain-containing protein n=1 Tax=Streptomyces sp. MMBL 11-3 TaxID=3382639 RepID=UPI0039B45E67
MRAHRMTLIALTVVAGLSLTACNGDDTPSPAASSSSDATSAGAGEGSGESAGAGTSTGSPGTGGKESAGGDSDAADRNGTCRTDALKITAIDNSISGDDVGSVAVTFVNDGGRDCTLSGFAGVDLKTAAGTVSAERTGDPADRITLKDGDSTAFTVSYPINDSGGSGVRITGLLVTPPGETRAATLKWPGAASLPVTDGSGSSAKVRVHPIGSAGQGG